MRNKPRPLADICVPRQSVFDRSRKDVVLYLGDLLSGTLGKDEAETFFAENYVTGGLKTLVGRVFDRVLGRHDQAATFLLSQAMGGGKTHSMLALGLLSMYPKLRETMWPHQKLGSEEVRVIGFDGRESDSPFGLWGALADQLDRKEVFDNLYSPLQAPGVSSWIKLLQGPPTVILLDELPAYFADAMSKPVGDSNLAVVTTTALSNLMVAANKAELSNVAIVISDLSATAYENTGTGVMSALSDLEKETNRSSLNIEPVATQGDEVFEILKKRLFETLPTAEEIDAVAVAYGEEIKKAAQMDLVTANPDAYAGEIRNSYPFHFSLRDLYGRFKENTGFQQTRGLLRMMRSIVANMWEQGRAKELHLLHPYDIDLNDDNVYTEFERINSTLNEAIRTDIANHGHSYAEELDENLKRSDASDAAKLIYISSLSTADKALLGLRDTEIVAWLCRPGRAVDRLIKDVLEVLPNRAWYLHMSTDGRLYFKNVQNLAARLYGMVVNTTKPVRTKELQEYLHDLFEPRMKDLYQQVYILPPIDEVKLSAEKVSLIVTEPYPHATVDVPLHPNWQQFFDQQLLQNRMLFLTGDRDVMEQVYKNAAYVRAIKVVLDEQENEGVSPRDAQAQEAQRNKDKYLMQLRSSVQQAFSTVVYPARGKLRSEHINFTFDNNKYDAEEQVRQTLLNNQKFSTDPPNDTWVKKVQDRLFDGQNPAPWNEVKQRAAVKTEWQFHHPGLLDDVRTYALNHGKWRSEGAMVRHGPFPKEPTSVQVNLRSHDDQTGEAILQVLPKGGSRVVFEYGRNIPTDASAEVQNYQDFRTKELMLSFLCIDDGPDAHPTGQPYTWENSIRIKGRYYDQGGQLYFSAAAIPEVPLYYTTDGSDPTQNGTSYSGDFPVPSGTHVMQIVGKKDGVQSSVETFNVPKAGGTIDPEQPATWECRKRYRNMAETEGFEVLERGVEYAAGISNVEINVSSQAGESLFYTLPPDEEKAPQDIVNLADQLRSLVTASELTITVGSLRFTTGQKLLDWQQHDRLSLDVGQEVQQ